MTAVEWLIEEIECRGITTKELRLAFEQAKEMEKQQENNKIDAIYEAIMDLYNNEEITGFSKRAYAQCLDIIEQFKNK